MFVSEIEKLCANAKKSANKTLSEQNVRGKLTDLQTLSDQISVVSNSINSLKLSSVESVEFDTLITSADAHRRTAEQILNTQLTQIVPSNSTSCTTMDFDFSLGLKLPILGDETDDVALRDFKDIVKSYHDTLKPAGQKALIEFVCLNRIQKQAKTRLGDLSSVTTYGELCTALFTRGLSSDTLESLTKKLSTARQGRKSLSGFVEDLEGIANKMATLEIQSQNLQDPGCQKAIKQVFETQALIAFKNGVHEELKVVVEASRPSNLADALAIATSSNLADQARPSTVNHYRGSNSRYVRHASFSRGRGNYFPRNRSRSPHPHGTYYRHQRNSFRGGASFRHSRSPQRGSHSNERKFKVSPARKSGN